MSEDERLREVLLEVHNLRESEARALGETRALLDILESVATARSPQTALERFLEQIARATDSDLVQIVRIDGADMQPQHGWPDALQGRLRDCPVDLRKKYRTFFDLKDQPQWAAFLRGALTGKRSLMTAPISQPDGSFGAILCFHTEAGAFTRERSKLLRRLGGFASQLLGSLQLSTQNALLAAVIDKSSAGFAISDATHPDLPLVFVNAAFETMTGYTASEVLGQNCRFLAAESRDAPERSRLRQAVATRKSGQFLLRNRRKDGSLFWNDLSLFPVKDADGVVSHLVATQTDASERVQAEEERTLAQRRLEATLAHTKDAFALILENGEVGFANQAHRQLYPAKGFDWREGSQFTQNWRAYVDSIPTRKRPKQKGFTDPDLHAVSQMPNGQRVLLPDGKHAIVRAAYTVRNSLVVSTTDITALRTTEQLLRQRAVAVENASEGIGIADENGRIVYANPSLAELFGVPDETALIGRKWRSFYASKTNNPHMDDLPAHDASNLRVLKTTTHSNIYHETVARFVEEVGEVLVVRNVTGRVLLQKRQAKFDRHMEHSSRQEAVSTLAAGIAHDFNNLLSAVMASATMISMEDAATEDIRKHASRISKAGSQASKLVNQLLDLGAPQTEAGVFDLCDVMREARDLVTPGLKSQVALDLELPNDAVLVSGQPSDASQVLVNLILNAQDAYGDDPGRILVSLRANPAPDPSKLAVVPTISFARMVSLTVADKGCGMRRPILDRIFEPYFSTKGRQGTGVGLPMVATLIERLGGGIAVDSELGRGTTFDVFWPLAETGPSHPERTNTPLPAPQRLDGLTILLVDDDAQVTAMLARFLEDLGAEVAAVQDPALAVESILDDPDGWSAVITDYEMPGMTGGDLVHKLRAAGAQVPIYLATGLAKKLSDPRITPQSVQGVFAKPLNLNTLTAQLYQDLMPAKIGGGNANSIG